MTETMNNIRMLHAGFLFSLLVCMGHSAPRAAQSLGDPELFKHLELPDEVLAPDGYAGDFRIGDLNGDGRIEVVVFRSMDHGHKPSYLAAVSLDGDILWTDGDGGGQPVRPGSVAVHDLDGDGAAEVICFFHDPTIECPVESLADVIVQVRDGRTGSVIREARPPEVTAASGEGANWVHQRILLADFRGTGRPRDFVVKLGERIIAFSDELDVLWTYTIPWNEYSRCSAYIPSVGDIDGDGRDEVNGGYFILDDDGSVRWQGQIGRHMDSVAIVPWDNGNMRAIASGFGHVLDKDGGVMLRLGEDVVPHGQEVRVADFDPTLPGPEMVIRYNGHNRDVMLVAGDGRIMDRFQVNYSPNNTGMEAIRWFGDDGPALLYNGGMLWWGHGVLFAEFDELPEPVGPARMGWYHCIPANVCGDGREEAVLYNPWDDGIWIFTPHPCDETAYAGYDPGPRQYNPRLMD